MSEESVASALQSPASLRTGLDLAAVVALGLGTAVGVAIFSVVAPAAALAGPGMLLSVVIAALPMFIIAVNYAFLGSAVPASGASYEWPRRFLHPAVGFAVAWLRVASSTSAMVVLALVLVRYLSMLVELPTKTTMFAMFTLVLLANLFGVSIAAGVQKVLMAALILLFLVFAAWGVPSVDFANFSPLLSEGIAGVLACVPLLLSLFFGIEAATEVGEEIKNSRTMIPIGIALSVLAAVILYLLVAGVALGVLGSSTLAQSQAPILDTAKRFMGPWATPVIVTAAAVAIGKSLNAIFLVFSRSLFAMARAGMLPSALSRVHPRWGTPYVACLTVFALCLAGLLLPMSLTFLFLAVSIPTLLKYLSTTLCVRRVVRAFPQIYDQATFRFGKRAMLVWSWAGAASAVAVIAAGISADWRPYAVLLVWAALGAIYYVVRGKPTIVAHGKSKSSTF
jgi:basic amino acid/polyamine antiporter, APA family